ncbi:hypothetical protein HPP92_004221 [Vanilla planifolia]|uniref:Uncharacterized protein n=1 Tax=Vanilla planifolia TaxID=51239 RepID=A0A835S393_VANPL|nr:hypothetical protein HPP92_004221 [Vanilla planifolia]
MLECTFPSPLPKLRWVNTSSALRFVKRRGSRVDPGGMVVSSSPERVEYGGDPFGRKVPEAVGPLPRVDVAASWHCWTRVALGLVRGKRLLPGGPGLADSAGEEWPVGRFSLPDLRQTGVEFLVGVKR